MFKSFENVKNDSSETKRDLINKKSKKSFLVIISIVIIFVIGFMLFSKRSNSSKPRNNREFTSDTGKPEAIVEIGKSFEFNAIDADKKKVPVKLTIVSAERKNEIRLKDEPRKPISGKDYLLLRVELQNDSTQRVAIATADRIRLEVDGKLYAPDYHNGNVVVDPISVRRDIMAFVVEENTKNFSIQVGELTGEKQKIEINF